jgi:processive 1,2-diacylglycerol beta-glucosyltransferase
MAADAQVVAITGRNEKLQARLEQQARHASRTVIVQGFTERVHEWMRAADLVVTKPGGLTVAEALACGLPLVIVNPIPGQETRNSDFLLENGAGIKVNNVRLLGHRVSMLLREPARMAALRAAAARLARPYAAREIVTDALQLIGAGG